MFIVRTDVEAETPILWPPDVKSRAFGKDSDAGKDWRREEKGASEDEMVWEHHWLNGHEFEQTPGNSEEQESVVCCSPWSHKESWLSNWTTAGDLYAVRKALPYIIWAQGVHGNGKLLNSQGFISTAAKLLSALWSYQHGNMDVIDLHGALRSEKYCSLSSNWQLFFMIPVYEDGEKVCRIKYWEHYEFAPIRKPHLGLIVAELKSPSDCVCYNHNNNFYLDQLVLSCSVVTELRHSNKRFKGICFNIDLWSNTLAWKIPWMEEPGRLQSMGSWRVRYNSATSLSLFSFMRWRRKWQPTPVFLAGESQGEPGGLPSMGSHRVGHNWSDLAAAWSNITPKFGDSSFFSSYSH